MKIVHVIDSGGLYGAERMLLCLMAEQARSGMHPVLCSIRSKGEPPKAIETEASKLGLHVAQLEMRAGPDLSGALGIARLGKREKTDLFHSHGYKADILLGFLPRTVRGGPVVATLHGWTGTGGFGKMRLYEWLDGRSLAFFDAVVVVHPSMLNHPRLRGRKRLKLVCVSNGIQSSGPPAGKAEGDGGARRFFGRSFALGTIGRLSLEKGHAILLDALRRLVQDGVDVKLAIVGEGPERGSLEEAARRDGIAESVLFTGYRAEVRALLASFDLFVLPSLTEGLPIVLLEAMDAGVPVLATRVGGVPGTLDEGSAGLLAAPGDSAELAKGIRRAIDHADETARLASRARSLFQERHSAESMAAGYKKVYETVLGASEAVK